MARPSNAVPTVVCLEFVVMPNHVHGVLALTKVVQAMESPNLSKIMRAFKSISAIEVNKVLSRQTEPVWQRNFYDRIIRDEKAFGEIRKYIQRTPERWDRDLENR